MPRKNPEGVISCAFVQRMFYVKPQTRGLLHHCPNEGIRNPRTGAYLKRMGMIPGWPDYQLCIPSEHYHGLFIELKTPERRNHKLPDNQIAVIERLCEQGYHAQFAFGLDEACEVVDLYLNNHKF